MSRNYHGGGGGGRGEGGGGQNVVFLHIPTTGGDFMINKINNYIQCVL